MTESVTKEITSLGDTLLGNLMGREVCRDGYTMALSALDLLRDKGIELEDWPALILIDGLIKGLWEQIDCIDKEIAEITGQMGDDALAETEERRLDCRRKHEKTTGIDIANEILGAFNEALQRNAAGRKERAAARSQQPADKVEATEG